MVTNTAVDVGKIQQKSTEQSRQIGTREVKGCSKETGSSLQGITRKKGERMEKEVALKEGQS